VLEEAAMKLLRENKFLRAEGGVAAIEMAFVLPIMLMLYFGLVDLTTLISYNRKVTSLANATADLVGQNRNSVSTAQVSDYFKIANLIMKPKPVGQVTINVTVYRNESGSIVQKWTRNNGGSETCTAQVTTGMTALMEAGNDLIVAQVCMRHKTFMGKLLGKYIIGDDEMKLEQSITLRPRSSLQINLS
jgi:Flp pilus assembly protein TadG